MRFHPVAKRKHSGVTKFCAVPLYPFPRFLYIYVVVSMKFSKFPVLQTWSNVSMIFYLGSHLIQLQRHFSFSFGHFIIHEEEISASRLSSRFRNLFRGSDIYIIINTICCCGFSECVSGLSWSLSLKTSPVEKKNPKPAD